MPEQTYFDIVPEHLMNSPLMQKGGFEIFSSEQTQIDHGLLLSEALRQFKTGSQASVTQDDYEEVRGGNPPRQFHSASGAEIQDTYYSSTKLLDFLSYVAGCNVHPSGEHGTFTYYHKKGDHIALHRDLKSCDLVLITSLLNSSDFRRIGGMLCIYPQRIYEMLSSIKTTPNKGAFGVHLVLGHSIVMLGGCVPHMVLPMEESYRRIVSVLCYSI